MKESHAIGISVLVLLIVIPLAYFGWQWKNKLEWNFSNKKFVQEMLIPLEARIVTLERKIEILQKELNNPLDNP